MRSLWPLLLSPFVVGCLGPTTESPSAASSETPLTGTISCAHSVRDRVLPGWATAGFSRPESPVAYVVVGTRGDIVGVVFGYPLHAPRPAYDRANKILWIANPDAPADPGAATARSPGLLRIEASLTGTDVRVTKELPLGPSYVDLPRAGCWIFTLSWGGHRDQLAIPYEPS